MATIYNSRSQSFSFEATTRAKVVADITRYWGSIENEKFYIISGLQLLELITYSPDPVKRAAVKITNVRDRNRDRVQVRWTSFPGDEIIASNPGDNSDYFVLDYEIEHWLVLHHNAVAARIAKAKSGHIYVYFQPVRVGLNEGLGTGAEGAIAGARIP